MLKASTVKIDCTPDIGFIVGLSEQPAEKILDPLFLRGLLLEDGNGRYFIGSLDFCALMGSAYQDLRCAIADSIGAPQDNVVIHCIHQHDAPLLMFEAERCMGIDRGYYQWWQDKIKEVADAVGNAVEQLRTVGTVGHAAFKLEGYASNRRVRQENGTISTRYSRCADPVLRNAPEGTIDPMLRTIVFEDETGVRIASLSFYATHPQVANNGKVFSADAPGEAMRLVSKRYPDGLHIFFTGTGGNITAGKYTHPSDIEFNLKNFGALLADGIGRNMKALVKCPAADARWSKASFPFPYRNFDFEKLKLFVTDPETPANHKRSDAAIVGVFEYHNGKLEYPVFAFECGGARIVMLGGEPFIQYQLFINSLSGNKFTAVAANCCDDFLYLPLAEDFNDKGGYETNFFCWCSEEFESAFKSCCTALLK